MAIFQHYKGCLFSVNCGLHHGYELRNKSTIAESSGNPVDGQVDASAHPLVAFPGPVPAQEFDL